MLALGLQRLWKTLVFLFQKLENRDYFIEHFKAISFLLIVIFLRLLAVLIKSHEKT